MARTSRQPRLRCGNQPTHRQPPPRWRPRLPQRLRDRDDPQLRHNASTTTSRFFYTGFPAAGSGFRRQHQLQQIASRRTTSTIWARASQRHGVVSTHSACSRGGPAGNLIHDIEKSNYGGWRSTRRGQQPHADRKQRLLQHQQHGLPPTLCRENIVRNQHLGLRARGMIQLSRGRAHNSLTFERNIIISDGQAIHVALRS